MATLGKGATIHAAYNLASTVEDMATSGLRRDDPFFREHHAGRDSAARVVAAASRGRFSESLLGPMAVAASRTRD